MDYTFLKNNNLILYEVISGSHAYGTNIESSDVDKRYVYILPLENILSGNYIDQVNDDKNDVVGYEIGRFLQLLKSNNPNLMELFNIPEECIVYKHPVFDLVLNEQSKFITKQCNNSFGKYAYSQISKAKGQNKKQNWELDRVTRKTPLDFCHIHDNGKSIPLTDFLNENNLEREYCGLSKVPHSKELYALFYDYSKTQDFRGIDFENSNDIRLTSIPKDSDFLGLISFSKDSYSIHCVDYKSYQTWLEKKNEQRWVDVKSHGQKIDGKNMMHCRRLMDMAREIAEGKGIIVRRPNADELLSIRRGEVDLQTLIDHVESEITEVDRLFKESNLPDSVDPEFIHSLIVDIRKKIYNLW